MPLPLDPRYIPAFSIEDVLLDKDTGAPLAGGKVYFEKDAQRGILKTVYQISGTSPNYTFVPLPNPVVLSSIGTFEDGAGNPQIPYFFPYDADDQPEYYYVRVTSSDDVPQFTREAVPFIPSTILPEDEGVDSENQVTNPQFVTVGFSPASGTTLSVSSSGQVSPIAPGWDIVTTGTGTVTINQVPMVATNIESQPPYALDIVSSGITSLKLRQRFYNSPRLLTGQNIYGSFIARTMIGGTPTLTLTYAPSSGSSITIVSQNVTNDGLFTTIKDVQPAPATNTQGGDVGYVDLLLDIPVGAHVQVSSFMLVAVTDGITSVTFPQESTGRQIDHTYHNHVDDILIRPKGSILSGWYFSLNPYQLPFPQNTSGDYTATVNEYIADQTILIQQNIVKNGVGSNVKKGLETNYNLKITALTANNQFAIIQYIDPNTAFGYWGYVMSALGRLRLNSTNGSSVRYKIRLFWNPNLPNIISQTDPIAAWEEGQDPQLAGGYNYILAENDPVYTLPATVSASNTIQNDTFNKFPLPITIFTPNQTLGIMVYTLDNMSTSGTPDYVSFQQVALVRNEFACQVNQKTWNETLADCEYYVESTYPRFMYPNINGVATPTELNQLIAPLNARSTGGGPFTINLYGQYLTVEWVTIKRITNPTVIVYSPITSVAGNIAVSGYADNTQVIATTDVALAGNYVLLKSGDNRTTYNAATASVLAFGNNVTATNIYGFARYQAIIDARIGVFHA